MSNKALLQEGKWDVIQYGHVALGDIRHSCGVEGVWFYAVVRKGKFRCSECKEEPPESMVVLLRFIEFNTGDSEIHDI